MTQTAENPAPPLDVTLMRKALEILEKATVDAAARTVTLPKSFPVDAYPVVREMLTRIGGVFDPKTQSTVFQIDPTRLIAALIESPTSFRRFKLKVLGVNHYEVSNDFASAGRVQLLEGGTWDLSLNGGSHWQGYEYATHLEAAHQLVAEAKVAMFNSVVILEHEDGRFDYVAEHWHASGEPSETKVVPEPNVKKPRKKSGTESGAAPIQATESSSESPVDAVQETVQDGAPESNTPSPVDRRLVPWQNIVPSHLNPRKRIDQATLEELAASIEKSGILQNLVVRPTANPDVLEIAAGERRWRAVSWLREQGRLEPDYAIPVVVRDLTDRELLELAVSENVQRSDMDPMDEAEGYAALHAMGASVEEIALRVGKSEATVQKRLAMVQRLAPEVKAAFREGRLSLAQAQAFTTGTLEAQARALKEGGKRHIDMDPNQLRRIFAVKRLHVKHAKFKPELYTGEIVTDLFGDLDPWYADAAQAERLQLDAAEAIRGRLEKKWAWARIHKDRISSYSSSHSLWVTENGKSNTYAKETDKARGGAFVSVDMNSLEVKVYEGWMSPQAIIAADRKASAEKVEKGEKPAKVADLEKSAIAATLQKHLGTQRSVTLTQNALDRVGRVPKREMGSSTIAGRVKLLADLLTSSSTHGPYGHGARVRPLERTELIGNLEGTGIAHARYSLGLSSPKSIESNMTFNVLVRPGELHIGIADWSKEDPDLTEIPTHAIEVQQLADVILVSTDNGSWSNLERGLRSALKYVRSLQPWDVPTETDEDDVGDLPEATENDGEEE